MVAAVLVVALLLVAVFGWTAFRVWRVAREDHRAQVDAIVVLGAAQFDGRPSTVFTARLQHALKLYQAGVAKRVAIVGGGAPGDRFTEGEAGGSWLQEHGVSRSDVIVVGSGRNTLDSLTAAVQPLVAASVRSVVLVTDPWHSLRSRTIARDLGFDAEVSPVRSGPAVRTRATQARYIVRETVGYLVYRVFGDVPHRKVPGAV
ncbi:MAG: YdcF family protein [Actinomycetota bacterium]